jgi:hypothetical protein
MGRKVVVEDISKDELKKVVKGYECQGAKVTKTKQDNGLWTVTAEFPN